MIQKVCGLKENELQYTLYLLNEGAYCPTPSFHVETNEVVDGECRTRSFDVMSAVKRTSSVLCSSYRVSPASEFTSRSKKIYQSLRFA